MSTKIYNAYATKPLTVKALNQFLQELKQLCTGRITTQNLKETAELAAILIDHLSLYQHNKKLSQKLIPNMQVYLTRKYETASWSPAYQLKNRPKPMNPVETIKNLKQNEYHTIARFARSIQETKLQRNEILENSFTRNDIVVFPGNTQILYLAFGPVIQDLLQEAISGKNPDLIQLKTTYQLKDYHYQNQTDRPDDISEKAWRKRQKDWEQALPTHIPLNDGLAIQLTTEEALSTKLYLYPDKDLMPYLPEKETRLHQFAWELLYADHIQNRTSCYEASRLLRNIQKDLNTESGTYYKAYQEYKNQLNDILPDINETLLNTHLKNLI